MRGPSLEPCQDYPGLLNPREPQRRQGAGILVHLEASQSDSNVGQLRTRIQPLGRSRTPQVSCAWRALKHK